MHTNDRCNPICSKFSTAAGPQPNFMAPVKPGPLCCPRPGPCARPPDSALSHCGFVEQGGPAAACRLQGQLPSRQQVFLKKFWKTFNQYKVQGHRRPTSTGDTLVGFLGVLGDTLFEIWVS
jgi:hypothetical protein